MSGHLRKDTEHGGPPSGAGRWKSLVIGFIITSVGLCVLGMGISGILRRGNEYAREEVPCVIVRFEIMSDPEQITPFQADLEYRYDYGGKSYTGHLLKPGFTSTDDYLVIAEPRNRLLQGPEGRRSSPNGVMATCRVDPSQPANSSLLRADWGISTQSLVEIVAAVLFTLIGAGYFRRSGIKEPLFFGERWKPKRSGGMLPVLVFGGFALGGTAGILITGRNVPEWWRMLDWPVAPGQVIWSRINTHPSHKRGHTYSTEIFYRYSVDGAEYFSNRSLLGETPHSELAPCEKEVARNSPGKSVRVYVDPHNPQSAVLNRDIAGLIKALLGPVIIAIVGYAGLVWNWRRRGERAG